MTRRGKRRFIDSLAEGKRPPGFRAGPEDLEELRTAVTLSASRPGAGEPDPQFVEDLFAELSEHTARQAPSEGRMATVTPIQHRRRNAMVSLAAAAALVAGTVGVTESVDHSASRPAASALRGHPVLAGSFETADHRKLGQITLFGGTPSWVFMTVAGSPYDGSVTCMLQSNGGSVVASGTFTVADGSGEWAKPLPDGVTSLRGARIVTSSGVVLAAATFSSLASAAS